LTITKNLPIFEHSTSIKFKFPRMASVSRLLTLSSILFALQMQLSIHAQDTLRISTPTVLCQMCKRTIEREVGFLSGVKWVQVDVAGKTTRVVVKGKKTTPELVRQTIVNSGYAADDLPANEKAYQQLPDCCRKETSTHE